MHRFRTNAQNLDELDIALAEAEAFSTSLEALKYDWPNFQYIGRHEIDVTPDDFDRFMNRVAMFDEVVDHLTLGDSPTLWGKIRGTRYDKRIDHSTHSLWPFSGKLEPRIARACINLAVGNKDDALVCDPFCGSGTIPLEASLMGFMVVAGDLDPFATWLTDTKMMSSDVAFGERLTQLWKGRTDAPPLVHQRDRCKPMGQGMVANLSAMALLNSLNNRPDAIVTSPPYYDAIDYNDRHANLRRELNLPKPMQSTMGIDMSLGEYEKQIEFVSNAMAEALKPQGRIVLVTASYRSVDVPQLFWSALSHAGLYEVKRLIRHYREPVLGITEDVILVMEKP